MAQVLPQWFQGGFGSDSFSNLLTIKTICIAKAIGVGEVRILRLSQIDSSTGAGRYMILGSEVEKGKLLGAPLSELCKKCGLDLGSTTNGA